MIDAARVSKNFVIRKSVFETNSSSSHSLTLGKGDLVKKPFTHEQLRSGKVHLSVGEYGWEYHRYYTPVGKLNYLLTQISHGDPSDLDEDDHRLLAMRRVVKQYTGCDLVISTGDTGGIDHESVGLGLDLFNDDKKLKNFLFDQTSYIETSNDNSEAPWLISTDKGEDELYYVRHIKDVPKTGFTSIKLKLPLDLSPRNREYITSGGAVLSSGINDGVFNDLLSSGVVSFVKWKCQGGYDHFEYTNVRTASILDIVSYEGFPGLPISLDFQAESHFTEVTSKPGGPMTSKREGVITVKLPVDLADRIASLPETPKTEIKFISAQNRVKYLEQQIADMQASQANISTFGSDAKWFKDALQRLNSDLNEARQDVVKTQKAHMKFAANYLRDSNVAEDGVAHQRERGG